MTCIIFVLVVLYVGIDIFEKWSAWIDLSKTKMKMCGIEIKLEETIEHFKDLTTKNYRNSAIDPNMFKFEADAFCENENIEQEQAYKMLKEKSSEILNSGYEIVQSGIQHVSVSNGTAHRVQIWYRKPVSKARIVSSSR